MFPVSANFKTKADDPQQISQRKFTYDGIDQTVKLLDMGSFSRMQFEGDDLNAGDITVLLLNDSKEFNSILTTKTNIGKIGKLELGFDDEFISRYEGKLDRVEFLSEERPKVRLTFVNRVKQAIERSIGSSTSPVNFIAQNPADLAWDVLTVHGGLSAVTDTTNPDIDYNSWSSYKTTCADLTFSLKAQFQGNLISNIMRLISELTDAIIFGETDGKIYFKKFIPSELSSYYTFNATNAHLQMARVYYKKDRIINKAQVFFGYDTVSKTFSGSTTKAKIASQTNYGIQSKIYDDTNIWHDTSGSATAFSERLIERYADPIETVVFMTKRGTQAMIHQIGDQIQLTWGQVDYTAKRMLIYGIMGDLTDGTYEITAEDIGVLNANFFILDSATKGILDQNVLY